MRKSCDYYLLGNSTKDLYAKLCRAHHIEQKVMAMIEIAKSRYFEERDPEKSMYYLKRSIEYYPKYCTNFTSLGELYIRQGNVEEGKRLIIQGLANIHELVTPTSVIEYDPVDIPSFFDEFFAGTVINFVEHARLLSLITNNSELSTLEH